MQDIQVISQYFKLSEKQVAQYQQLVGLLLETNKKINIVSRKNEDQLVVQHILHSLGIAAFYPFSKDAQILDVGTGGGLPGLPLAIMFPDAHFTLIDGTRKKIDAVKQNAEALGLKNVKTMHIRVEELKSKFDFIISRAVTNLPAFTNWVHNKVTFGTQGGMHKGIYYLRGLDFDFGTINEEIHPEFDCCKIENLSEVFNEPFFESKKLVVLKKL